MERQPREGVNWEALGGIVVGAAALLISVYTAYLEHRHAQAEVWPRLEMWSTDDGGGFKTVVANKGTGPASIRDWRRRLDGHPVTTWTPWVDTVAGRHVPIGNFSKWNIADATLSPGDSITIFSTSDHELAVSFRDSRHLAENFICYCSVFDDCWVLESRKAHKPTPVAECPDPGPESWVGIGEAEEREVEALYGAKVGDAGTSEDH